MCDYGNHEELTIFSDIFNHFPKRSYKVIDSHDRKKINIKNK